MEPLVAVRTEREAGHVLDACHVRRESEPGAPPPDERPSTEFLPLSNFAVSTAGGNGAPIPHSALDAP
ncbi:hypothetical protein CH289_09555 [Rhodococcus sp. RS1C4]|nr:hypothetical protein CH267_23350 [Rhodococcus sp. 06-621-2]OZC54502.1 hypothetical protein CH289_09555 [Rhodococcus sp. RS1C4]OZD69556.1 hypothetical protein CH263_07160 [Rhodococcus sp. 06-1059B-a]OZE83057.1 hypothetical protein CH304_10675 [Rhodococcus sp. 15-649-1-2]OZF06986.1 hypothetical protein CH300_09420 [Rhodococcus sp. 15-1154-1]OZF49035.1 hypothetical protein CH292_14835 [Rhodococcus sp. 14-2470-1a]